jgi:hypothetical protein
MLTSLCGAAVRQRILLLPRLAFAVPCANIRALSSDSFFISRNSKSQPVQVSRSFISQSRERVLSGIQPTGVPHIGAISHLHSPHSSFTILLTLFRASNPSLSTRTHFSNFFSSGNYFGALRQWASLQCDDQVFQSTAVAPAALTSLAEQ